MSEELQSGPVIIPLSAYNVGFGGGVSEEEVNELIENSLDNIKDQIDELSANAGGSIEGVTDCYNTAIGYEASAGNYGTAIGIRTNGSSSGVAIGGGANGSSNGVAIGSGANGSADGIAIGLGADGSYYGTAIGYSAEAGTNAVAIGLNADASDGTVAIGYAATLCGDDRIVIKARNSCNNGDVTLAVTDDGKLLVNGNEIGSGSSIEGVTDNSNTGLGKGATVCTHSTSIGYDVGGGPNSVAIGYRAKVDASSVVIGETATGDDRAVAIGYMANGQNRSVAIGYDADANYGTVAIGYEAKGCGDDRIVIKARNNCNNDDITLKVTDDGKLYINDKEIGSGSGSSIEGVTTSTKTVIGYCADGVNGTVAIGYEAKSCGYDRIVIKARNSCNNDDVILKVTDDGKLLINGNEIGAGSGSSIEGVTTSTKTVIGYCADGVNGTVAIGSDAKACGDNRIVIKARNSYNNGDVTLAVTDDGKLLVNDKEIGAGSGSSIEGVTGYGDTAIGMGTNACGYSTVLGYNTFGSGGSTVIGTCARGSSEGIAIGYMAEANDHTVAIGYSVQAYGDNRIVIKARNSCNNGDVTLKVTDDGKLLINDNEIGAGSSGGGSGGSIDLESELKQLDPVAIGYGATAIGSGVIDNYSIAIGSGASAKNSDSIAIGSGAVTRNSNTIAIGVDATADSSYPIHLNAAGGADLKVSSDGKLLINGNEIGSSGSGSIEGVTSYGETALGKGTTVCVGSTTIGYNAYSGSNGVAIGNGTNGQAAAVAIGYMANASGDGVTIGKCAESAATSVTIGNIAKTYSCNSIAIGYGSAARYPGAIAIGNGAVGCNDYGIAIGDGAISDNNYPIHLAAYEVNLKVSSDGTLLIGGCPMVRKSYVDSCLAALKERLAALESA